MKKLFILVLLIAGCTSSKATKNEDLQYFTIPQFLQNYIQEQELKEYSLSQEVEEINIGGNNEINVIPIK
jgi:hypothetical protein